jgi:hypothetical protein
LAKLGEFVQVKVGTNTYIAKVAKSLAGLDVLLIKSKNRYYAYPAKPTGMQGSTETLSFIQTKPRKKKKPAVLVYGIVIKVKRTETMTLSCKCPTWTYNGYDCVEVCNGTAPYETLQQCRNNIPPDEYNFHPNTQLHSVGYFSRGFLDNLGAPEFDLGFWYPTISNPSGQKQLSSLEKEEYPYCNSGREVSAFVSLRGNETNLSNFTLPPVLTAQPNTPVITGYVISPEEYGLGTTFQNDLLFTGRQWILPGFPNRHDIFIRRDDESNVNATRHYYYRDSKFPFPIYAGASSLNIELWQQWENIYKTQFYNPVDLVQGQTTIPFFEWAGLYQLERVWSPSGFLFLAPRLTDSGQILTEPSPIGIGGIRIVYNTLGVPNWLWKEVQINCIAINNTIYGAFRTAVTQEFVRAAQANYKFHTGLDINYNIRTVNLPENSPLRPPAAAVVTKSVNLLEETPYPSLLAPGEKPWTLLYDTRTCPPNLYDPIPDPGIDYTYDVYDYYLITNIVEPLHLLTIRSDDLAKVYLTATESEVYGTILYGSRQNEELTAEEPEINWCKLKTFISDGTMEEFTHEIPEDTPPFFPDDWQAFRNTSFIRADDEASNPCFNSFSDPDYGTISSSAIRVDEDGTTIHRIDLAQQISVLDENEEPIDKPWTEVVLDQPVTIELQVFDSTGLQDGFGNPISCEITPTDTFDIDLEQIPEESEAYIAPLDKENTSIETISVFYSPE